MSQKIAIIGFSARVPKCNTLDDFINLLNDGRDSVDDFSSERLQDIGFELGSCHKVSQLDNISHFDNDFFNISVSEAITMDPTHRILLELVYHCIESAGIPMSKLKGTNTSVFFSNSHPEYYKLFKEFSPGLLMGNLPSISAGRVSRFFDLRGNAVMVDSGCSSTLVAIHQAINEITSGDSEMAFVGGIKINLFPIQNQEIKSMGIFSNDNKTNSYSDTASGTGNGEAGGVILLKKYEDAIRDNDLIHAVIIASGVNQDAALSVNITSPSSIAQTNLYKKVWDKAKINPEDISFIEGHGTATKIGDPIEIKGLSDAFDSYTDKKIFCAISSAKSNIGHADNAAGIVGVIKSILSLKTKKIFPNANFVKPNSLIDFNKTAIYPVNQVVDWNNDIKLLGISSFSLSGTNCHLLLKEEPLLIKEIDLDKNLLVCISAKSKGSLNANVFEAKRFIESSKDIEPIAYTYNVCKDHYKFREVLIINDFDVQHITTDVAQPTMFFCLGLFSQPNLEDLIKLGEKFDWLKEYIDECIGYSNLTKRIFFDQFVFLYSLTKGFNKIGIVPKSILTVGCGKIVVKVIMGELSLKAAILSLDNESMKIPDDFELKLQEFLTNLPEKHYSFIDFGDDAIFSSIISRTLSKGDVEVSTIKEYSKAEILKVLGQVYLWGIDLRFDLMYSKKMKPVDVPLYKFEEIKFWTKLEKQDVKTVCDSLEEIKTSDPREKLFNIWKEILGITDFSYDDDFFDLGGYSLHGTQMINRIQELFDVTIEFDVLYDYTTINTLSIFLLQEQSSERLKDLKIETSEKNNDLNIKKIDFSKELSSNQLRLWLMVQRYQIGAPLNVPTAFKFNKKMNIEILEQAIQRVVDNHESLRTSFDYLEGKPQAIIHDSVKVNLSSYNFESSVNELDEVLELFNALIEKSFDLKKSSLMRVALVKGKEDTLYLLFVLHHIISDAWSIYILWDEVIKAYESIINGFELSKPKIQFQHFVEKEYYEQGNQIKQEKLYSYWHKYLNGNKGLVNFHVKTDSSGNIFKGGESVNFIEGNKVNQFNSICKKNKISEFTLVMTAMFVAINRKFLQSEITLGYSVSIRNDTKWEKLIGYLVNTVAIRVENVDEMNLNKLISKVKKDVITGISHSSFNIFDLKNLGIIKQSKTDTNPIYNAGVTWLNMPVDNLNDKDEFSIEALNILNTNKQYPLWLFAGSDKAKNKIEFRLEFSLNVFSKLEADDFLSDVSKILDEMFLDLDPQ